MMLAMDADRPLQVRHPSYANHRMQTQKIPCNGTCANGSQLQHCRHRHDTKGNLLRRQCTYHSRPYELERLIGLVLQSLGIRRRLCSGRLTAQGLYDGAKCTDPRCRERRSNTWDLRLPEASSIGSGQDRNEASFVKKPTA